MKSKKPTFFVFSPFLPLCFAIIVQEMNFLFAFLVSKQYLCRYFKTRDMELKCPQCGKWMAVSQEELVIHDCQVVCPQCLAVCQYEGGALVVRDDSDAPYRHNAAVESDKRETAKFCHSCGKKLPEGISFCPYCGVDLSAPFEAAAPEPVVEPKPVVHAPEPVREERPEPVPERQSTPEPSATHQSRPRVEDKLRTITQHYSVAHPHPQQHGTMPGTTFKIVAYTVIALLLILLVYIIIAGLSIEPSM